MVQNYTSLNVSLFISKRLIKGNPYKNSISAPIIKIAISAIAVGLVMMLIAMGTGFGLQTKIREKVSAFNGHIQVLNFDNNNSNVSIYPIDLEQDFYTGKKSIEGISHIQGIVIKAGVIRTAETFEGIIAKGIGKDYDWGVIDTFITAGRHPNVSDEISNEVMISKTLANALQLKIGDLCNTFFLRNDNESKFPSERRFTIVGIYDSGFEEFDASYVFVDIKQLQRVNKWESNQIGHFELFVKDFDHLDEITQNTYLQTSSNLDVRSVKERYSTIFEWIKLFDFNIALIIGIMILVGGINIVTALLVLVLERTNTIGILKALGASNTTIRKMFIYQASYLILLGLFWGNLIGIGLLVVQEKFKLVKFPNPKDYYISYIPIDIQWTSFLMLNVGVFLVCVLMLLIPSYAVSKIAPVKAIKFD